MKFSGSIRIGIPSRLSPRGALGRRIVLPISVVKNRIHTLWGCAAKLGHDGVVVGRITRASVKGQWIEFEGELNQGVDVGDPRKIRFSYEIHMAIVADYSARRVWTIRKFESFKGMALIRKPATPAHQSSKMRIGGR
jgi:hypothetical protein